jgi:secreted protein with Ig-like and vWFA domain
MNDDTDKPLNTVGDDALEARITAWVLGEASSFEAGELEKLCAADPALRLFERRLRVLHGLVAEDFKAGPAAEWKLSEARRAKITDLLGVEPAVVEVEPGGKKSLGPVMRGLILALAACVVIGVFTMSMLGGLGVDPKHAAFRESPQIASYSAPMSDMSVESPIEAPSAVAKRHPGAKASLPSRPRSAPEDAFDGATSESLAGPVQELAGRVDADFIPPAKGMAVPSEAAVSEPLIAGNRSGDGAITRSSIDGILNNPARATGAATGSTDNFGPESVSKEGEAEVRARMLAEVDQTWELTVPPAAPAPRAKPKADAGTAAAAPEDPLRSNPALAEDGAGVVDEVRGKLHLAEGNHDLGKFDDAQKAYEEVLRVDPYNKAARRGMEKVAAAKSDYDRAVYDQTRAELQVETHGGASVPANADKLVELESLLDFEKTGPDAAGRYSGLAEKEMLRRQNSVAQSDTLRDEGRAAYAAGNFPEAYRKYVESFGLLPDAPMLKDRRDYIQQVLQDTARALSITAERVGQKELAHKWMEKSGKWAPKKAAVVEPTAETLAADEPFSTFSLHVSDASFKLAHAAVERGEVPAAESIRPEEFYNAFDYGDPAPAAGEPVVCVTEQSAHPAFAQRNLLRIGVRTGSQGRGASTPLNLTLLLDHSGSMEREDRNAGLAMAVRQLSSLLKEGDTITVAGFSRQPRLLADRLPGARAQELNELIARTPSEGGTNLEEGLKLGEELAKRQFNPAAQNRVVLFTDGAANLGDARPEALQARIEGLRQQVIAFDAAGFGADGLNDKLLERLTRNGNGRYYIVDGPEDADAGFAKQLAGAFRPAAENVKVQVRFNPARVAKYKLIGFEEHRLQKEDFRNDAVDAAEMAAEEAGNALYQIETLPQGEGEVGEVSVRFRDVASGQMVERTWTIPYDAHAPAFDKAAPSIQLAGLAAFTAEKLRAAPMADAVDFQQLGQVYAGVRARYPNSQPVADLGSMIGKMK